MAAASTSVNGYLTSTDWNTFNNKGSGSVTSVAATVPSLLSISGSPITTSGTLAITYSGTALPVANGGTGLTTLTAGYIPYGNGTSAFGSSANLFWDSTNSRLGIGTASPAKKIDISVNVNAADGLRITNTNTGSSAAATSFYSNNTHTHELGIFGTNYGGYGALTASNFYLYAGGNNDLSLCADGTGVIKFGTGSSVPERMRIDSSGNVGIGTSSPTNKLQVNGVMVGNNASGSYTKGFGGILTTTSTSTPTGGSSGDFALIY